MFTKPYILKYFFLVFFLPLLSACGRITPDVSEVEQDSVTYVGQLSDGKRHGLGALLRGDTVLYSGQWAGGLRQGAGWTADMLGERVEGVWDHDTIVSGSRRCEGEGYYEGQLDSALRPHGHGVMQSADAYYEGWWEEGNRHGIGFEMTKTRFRVGEWEQGTYRGERLGNVSERIYGIDISKYQHGKGRKKYKIDWSRLRISHLGSKSSKYASGTIDFPVSFIFIKATEGRSVRNSYYAADYAAARAHGYPVGSYHFFTHLSTGADQAKYFLAHAHVRTGDLPPVLDLEPLPAQVKAMGGSVSMWRRVRNWLQMVEKATGMRPILYISQTFVNKYLDDAPDIKRAYPVWIARYGEYKPDVKLWLWQLAPDGRVTGIRGEVDINVFNGYQAEFEQWLNKVRKK